MDCNCGERRKRKHNVVRKFKCVAEYFLCSQCERIEWIWFTDDFEIEINEKPYLWLNEGSTYGLQKAI
jgi:hypothetical protein